MIEHIIKHTKIMKCGDCFGCSDNRCDKFMDKLGLKLRADNPEDTVNGSLSIDHGYGEFVNNRWINTDKILRAHTFTVIIYTETEKPNSHHQSTLQKPSKIPTKKQCEDCLT